MRQCKQNTKGINTRWRQFPLEGRGCTYKWNVTEKEVWSAKKDSCS